MTTYKTGAIGDKRRLLEFFAAKGHENLVLRIADVLELLNAHQDWLIRVISRTLAVTVVPEAEGTGWRKQWLLHLFSTGYIVLPFDDLFRYLNMDEVKRLQEVCFVYHGIRLEKGEPSRAETCSACAGTGKFQGKTCPQCEGGGQIFVFLEMSDEERALARGEAA